MSLHRQPVTWNALVSKFTPSTILSPRYIYFCSTYCCTGNSSLARVVHTLTAYLQHYRCNGVNHAWILLIHILTQLRSFTGFNGFGWSIWFTLWHLIDNTIVAMVWVTHGFCCLNHETWVITWVRHLFFFNINNLPTFCYLVIDAMSHCVGFRRFIDDTLGN